MSGFQANHHHLKALTYKHRTPSYTVNTLLTVNVYVGGKPRTQNRVQTNKKKKQKIKAIGERFKKIMNIRKKLIEL